MSTDNLIADTAARIFAENVDKELLDRAETGEFPQALWQLLCENGFHLLACAESAVPMADVFAVVKESGRYAVPLPMAEVLFANRWLAASQEIDEGIRTIGLLQDGSAVESPWGRIADQVLLVERGNDAVNSSKGALSELASNLAGEPRDAGSVTMQGLLSGDSGDLGVSLYQFMVVSRAVQLAGTLEQVLDLCLQYAMEREQFGRPIAKFQAIQHNLAVMAGEVAAGSRAAAAAVDSIGQTTFLVDMAAAKIRTGEAAGVVAEMAHQVHGAMGFTHEHQLHHFTRRLWAWRDEYGNEAYWQDQLAKALLTTPADQLWQRIATSG